MRETEKRILVVDDEASMRELLGIMLRRDGYHVLDASSFKAASAAVVGSRVDMVITDVRLPDGNGIDLLRQVKAATPETIVLMMTAFGSTEDAVTALKLGAHDYLIKPFDVEELKIVVRNALERERLQEENRLLKAEFRAKHALERIVGASESMQAILKLIRSVAETSSTVLITGESGTGKELVAKALHAISPRRDSAFVSVNCGAFPEPLLESELFGHMKGAFTDAHQSKKGLFEVAHRGTLFLDEVGDTPLAMQVKLLRALQEKRIRRVGGTEEIDVDVRIVAATNRELDGLVRERRFREDLYYRLNVIPVHVPPLRSRREDIPVLASTFLERLRREMGRPAERISDEAMRLIVEHPWPGNVRELENVIERAVALETGSIIGVERLPDGVRFGAPQSHAVRLREGFSLDDHVRTVEGDLVRRALDESGGDRAAACRLLGISPRSLRYLIRKHGLGLPA
jgi:two-component system, NtrC family, response regulator PilR